MHSGYGCTDRGSVFLFTYALIIDERIHRAVAAMLGAAIVVFVGIVPPWEALLEHVDFGTIFLLLGMMIIVNTARGSGLFEYIAIRTAKLAGGEARSGFSSSLRL